MFLQLSFRGKYGYSKGNESTFINDTKFSKSEQNKKINILFHKKEEIRGNTVLIVLFTFLTRLLEAQACDKYLPKYSQY